MGQVARTAWTAYSYQVGSILCSMPLWWYLAYSVMWFQFFFRTMNFHVYLSVQPQFFGLNFELMLVLLIQTIQLWWSDNLHMPRTRMRIIISYSFFHKQQRIVSWTIKTIPWLPCYVRSTYKFQELRHRSNGSLANCIFGITWRYL